MVSSKNCVKYVAYYYRSLNRQAVAEFVEYNDGTLVGEFVEGSKKWPRLADAIEQCKADNATLVIGKLGRLVLQCPFLDYLVGFASGLRMSRQPEVQPTHGPYSCRCRGRGGCEGQSADAAVNERLEATRG